MHISTGDLGIYFSNPKKTSPPSPPSPYHNLPFSANNLPLSRNNGRLLPHFSFTTVRWSRGRPSAVAASVSLPAAGAAPSGSKPSLRVSNIAFSYCCSFFILVASGEKSFKSFKIVQNLFILFVRFVGFLPREGHSYFITTLSFARARSRSLN